MHFARPSTQEFIATSEVVAMADEASTDHENNGATEVQFEKSILRWPFFPCSIIALLLSIFLSIAILMTGNEMQRMPTELYLSEHKRLYESWKARPFVDLQVSDSRSGCSLDYEPILYRVWNGTVPLCLLNNAKQ